MHDILRGGVPEWTLRPAPWQPGGVNRVEGRTPAGKVRQHQPPGRAGGKLRQRLAIRRLHHRRGKGTALVPRQWEQGHQIARRPAVVGIEIGEEGTACRRHAAIAGRAGAGSLLRAGDQPDHRILIRECAVVVAIVDAQDNLG